MKNHHVERLRLAAKQFHRNNRKSHFDNGIEIHHIYDEQDPDRLSWWDDVSFILNDYRVALAWVADMEATCYEVEFSYWKK